MSGLDLSTVPVELVLHILNIVVLFLVLRALVYRPVKNFLAARSERIASEMKAAQDLKQQSEELKAKYEADLSDSAHKGDELIHAKMLEADAAADRIIAEAKARAEEIVSDAKMSAQRERQQILEKMRDEVADISVEIAGRILGKEIKAEDNSNIIDQYLEEVV